MKNELAWTARPLWLAVIVVIFVVTLLPNLIEPQALRNKPADRATKAEPASAAAAKAAADQHNAQKRRPPQAG